MTILPYLALADRHPGVTAGIGMSYEEAIRVCLDRHHASPVEFSIRHNDANQKAECEWLRSDDALKRGWANKDDATAMAAYGIALAAVELTLGLVAIGRAETRTGADYYLAAPGAPVDDLEAAVRLEVSGTDEGSATVVANRLEQKLEQALNGNSNVPAMAAVVGFAVLKIASADLEAP